MKNSSVKRVPEFIIADQIVEVDGEIKNTKKRIAKLHAAMCPPGTPRAEWLSKTTRLLGELEKCQARLVRERSDLEQALTVLLKPQVIESINAFYDAQASESGKTP